MTNWNRKKQQSAKLLSFLFVDLQAVAWKNTKFYQFYLCSVPTVRVTNIAV
jgi:hypothetical protein